jgi:hypothetical protein
VDDIGAALTDGPTALAAAITKKPTQADFLKEVIGNQGASAKG